MIWQTVTSQMLLFDDHEIDTISLGLLADVPGFGHVCGVDRAVHAKSVEYFFCLIDKIFGAVLGHKLSQVGFPQLVDIVQLPV